MPHSDAALQQEWRVVEGQAMLDQVGSEYTLAHCLAKESDFQLALSLHAAEAEQEHIGGRLRASAAAKGGAYGVDN